jgi:CHRD domain
VNRRTAVLTLALVAIVSVAFAHSGDRGGRRLSARLSGYEEVPALSSTGKARLVARINHDETEIDWRLSYEDMEAPITQAHIHFNARALNGPIVVFFCTNGGNGPAGTQLCPDQPATISGTIVAADVLGGAAAVGLEAGNLEELIAAIRAGATYANVHTTLRPAGETRGQIEASHDRHDHR